MRRRRLALESRVDDLSGYTREELVTYLATFSFFFSSILHSPWAEEKDGSQGSCDISVCRLDQKIGTR